MRTRLLFVAYLALVNLCPLFGQPTKRVDPLSARSLSLITSIGDTAIATATGFIVKHQNKHFLITNWHVVTGKDPSTGKIEDPFGRTPTVIAIWYHAKTLGNWVRKIESLYSPKGKPNWIEHPLGSKVDVVAFPLSSHSGVQIYPFDLTLANTDMVPAVAMPVSIIGFPFGLSGPGKFPIWKTGHIATDPELDYDNMPVFLIDATTRPGMSGSLVVLRLTGGYETKSGGAMMASSGMATLFLGIYSAQQTDSEIGKVWRPEVITEILNTSK